MLLLFGHLMILSICLIFKIVNIENSFVGYFFIATSSLLVLFYITKIQGIGKSLKLILLLGFIIRIILVFVDVYLVRIVDAGTDDDGFYNASLDIYESDYRSISQNIYGGFFPKLLSIAYYFVGSSRIVAQYVNILLYVISSIIFLKTLINYDLSKRTSIIAMAIFCFLPIGALNNSVLRRETAMELCICLSIFYFSKWYVDKHLAYKLSAILFMALASLFHTAMIFAALFYAVYFSLYDDKKNKISFSINKMSKMIIVLICTILAGVGFLSLWNNKFTAVTDMDDVYVAASRARGGSVYLKGMEINSLGQLVIFAPVKLFYFLFSPVPWNFRGIMDIVSFLFDALVYLVLIVRVIRSQRDSASNLMMVIFVAMSIIFALGTYNSGTALRHRFTLMPFLLIGYSIVDDKRHKRTVIKKENVSGLMRKSDEVLL